MRYGLTKTDVVNVLEICLIRRESGLNCLDCVMREKCVDAHKYMLDAVHICRALSDSKEGED